MEFLYSEYVGGFIDKGVFSPVWLCMTSPMSCEWCMDKINTNTNTNTNGMQCGLACGTQCGLAYGTQCGLAYGT
jgi:hypothetical protein